MKKWTLILVFILEIALVYSQDNSTNYYKIDSIARKTELNILSKGVEYLVLFNTYGKENQNSSNTAIWREGKTHFIEYTKVTFKGIITKEKKNLKAASFFTDINHFLSDTITKPDAYPVTYASHFSINIKMKKDIFQDVFDASTIGTETSYSSTEIFKLIERYLKQTKFIK